MIKPKKIVGKTIKSIDDRAINAWIINFTDGTSVTISAEQMVYTPAGNIPGLILEKNEQG